MRQELLNRILAFIVFSASLVLYNKFVLLKLQDQEITRTKRSCEPNLDPTTPESQISPFNARGDFEIEDNDPTVRYACCYRDRNNPINNVGRPFPLTDKVQSIINEYMLTPGITHEQKEHYLVPQPVTGFSANHYSEHLKQIGSALRLFKTKKIVIYDL